MYRDRSSRHRHRSVTPGGTEYRQVSTYQERVNLAMSHGSRPDEARLIASNGHRSRRDASGLNNPSHDSPMGMAILRIAARSPNPHAPTPNSHGNIPRTSAAERTHLLNQARTFNAVTPEGTPYGVVQNHATLNLAHNRDRPASQYFNDEGHFYPKPENHHRNTHDITMYQGVEPAYMSAASGRAAPRYAPPRPSRGSHPSYYDPSRSDFTGGFGSYYQRVPGTSSGVPSSSSHLSVPSSLSHPSVPSRSPYGLRSSSLSHEPGQYNYESSDDDYDYESSDDDYDYEPDDYRAYGSRYR